MDEVLGFLKKQAGRAGSTYMVTDKKLVPVRLKSKSVSLEDVEKAFRFAESRKMKYPEDADELEDIFAFLRRRLFPARKQAGVKHG